MTADPANTVDRTRKGENEHRTRHLASPPLQRGRGRHVPGKDRGARPGWYCPNTSTSGQLYQRVFSDGREHWAACVLRALGVATSISARKAPTINYITLRSR